MRQQIPTLDGPRRLMEWARRVRLALNILVSGYPFPPLDADPTNVTAGYTYYNTVSNTTRQWTGVAWVVL